MFCFVNLHCGCMHSVLVKAEADSDDANASPHDDGTFDYSGTLHLFITSYTVRFIAACRICQNVCSIVKRISKLCKHNIHSFI